MKSINIEIIDVMEKEANGRNGKPYKYAEVTFKEYYMGKPSTKGYKALEFNTPEEVYQTLLSAKKGDTLSIIVEKNAAGYNQWVEIATQQGDIKGESVGSKAEQYKEQDDRRQTLIVRQSTLRDAVTVAVAQGEFDPDVIKALAEQFEAHINR